jgi:hypothetical protein
MEKKNLLLCKKHDLKNVMALIDHKSQSSNLGIEGFKEKTNQSLL